MTPDDSLEQDPLERDVHDRASFFDFVRALIDDRRQSVAAERAVASSSFGPDTGGWENTTIESFLEQALSWAESTKMGESQGLGAGPSWQAFAAFLYCGKIYE